MLRLRYGGAQTIGGAKVANVFAVMPHDVLARKVEVVSYTCPSEDFAMAVEAVDGVVDTLNSILGDHIPSDKIAEVEVCLESSNHLRWNMSLKRMKIHLGNR